MPAPQPTTFTVPCSHGVRAPTVRRRLISQISMTSMIAGMKNPPLSFTEQAQPRKNATPSRHHGMPSRGLSPSARAPLSRAASIRLRRWSRSSTTQPKAASTKSMRKMSSSAARESTKCRPSRAMSRPATQPRIVDRNRRRAMRTSSRIEMMPATAAPMRHPNEL
jgi:hypothetical protein